VSAAATPTGTLGEPPPTLEVRPDEPGESLTAAAGTLLDAFTEQARHVGELAAAEARLAALSVVGMLICGVLAAVALLGTWVLLLVLAVDGLAALGRPWQLAAALLAAVQLAAAYLLWRSAVGLAANLALPRLRRTLLGVGRAPAGGATPE